MSEEKDQEIKPTEAPPPKRKRTFWKPWMFMLPVALAVAGLLIWQILGQAKPTAPREPTLITSEPPPPPPPPPPPEPAPEPQPVKTLSEAEQILMRCAETYAKANAWRASYSLGSTAKAESDKLSQSVAVDVVLKKPMKFRQASQGAGLMGISLDTVIICDGENTYTYVASLRQALQEIAPKDLVGLAADLAPEMPERVSEPALMAGIDPLKTISSVTLIGTETVNGHECYVLDLTYGEEQEGTPEGVLRKGEEHPQKSAVFQARSGSQRLWIGTQDYLIWKQRLDMTGSSRSVATNVFGGGAESSGLAGSLSAAFVMNYSEVHLDENIPDSWFVFTLPQGAKLVGHLDLRSLLEDIIGSTE